MIDFIIEILGYLLLGFMEWRQKKNDSPDNESLEDQRNVPQFPVGSWEDQQSSTLRISALLLSLATSASGLLFAGFSFGYTFGGLPLDLNNPTINAVFEFASYYLVVPGSLTAMYLDYLARKQKPKDILLILALLASASISIFFSLWHFLWLMVGIYIPILLDIFVALFYIGVIVVRINSTMRTVNLSENTFPGSSKPKDQATSWRTTILFFVILIAILVSYFLSK